jgi:hypothetical protein
MFAVQLYENEQWIDLQLFATREEAEVSERLSRSVPARVVDRRFTVRYGVKGAGRVSSKSFDTQAEAVAFAQRWSRSNSRGSYWAGVYETERGTAVRRFNLD